MGRAVRSSVLAWTAAVWVATGAFGHAETAPGYRAPAVGTEFVISDTTWFRVIGAADDAVTTEDAARVKTTWLFGLVTRDMPAEDRGRLMGLFPLTPGVRLAYGARWASTGAQRELAVVANDVVQVDGRAIPVLRVTRHQVDVTPIAVEGEYTLWFAPEYGFPLKMTYRHISGDPPTFHEWQVAHIVPPPGVHGGPAPGTRGVTDGSVDGVWRLSVECNNGTFFRLNRAVVRDGVVVNAAGDRPSAYSATQSDLRLSRTGDQLELKGTMMNASGQNLTISAHGTLAGESASGLGILNVRTGCAFTAARQ